MSFSRVLFVGLGGAGQRHLRILRALLPHAEMSTYRRTRRTPLLRADFSVDPTRTVEVEYDLQVHSSLDAAFATSPDLTVVSTPTAHHREPMRMAMAARSGVLVEKPWAESSEGFTEFSAGMLANALPFHISFQRRFHPLIARARTAIAGGTIGRPMAATFTVFSHVPSWHPYEDWRGLYAVRRELGGGVLLTEIHELDLAHWFFGMPDTVYCEGGNWGSERLDVEDTVQMTLAYQGFSVQVTLCFMHPKPSRSFHVAGTNGSIHWDGSQNQLVVDSADGTRDVITDPGLTNDAMFFAQAERFVSHWCLADTVESLTAAGGSLAIVEAARRSMESKRAERVDKRVVDNLEPRAT